MGESDIFDEDEVFVSPQPFPPKYRIPREIYFALSEVGQCLTTLEDMLPENPGHLKGDSAVRVRVEPILSLDAEDGVEAKDTPL